MMTSGSAPSGDAGKLLDMIEDIRIAMLTTREAEGMLRSRPMWTAKGEEGFTGDLWFFTRASSHKVLEISGDHQVNLAYADPDDQDYVSVSGTAELVRDRERIGKLWKEPMRTWFPEGLDDPDLALLRVRVSHAEYWDSASGAMVFLYGYVKASLTGKTPKELGNTGRVDFD